MKQKGQHLPPAPVLTALNLGGVTSFVAGQAQGAFIANIGGSQGGALSLSGTSAARLQTSALALQVGATASSSGDSLSFNLIETLSGATGSPKTTALTLSVTAPASGINQGNDGSGSPPAGTATTPATFAANLSAAATGDTLVLAPGTYYGGVTSINKGTGAGVTIYGQTGVIFHWLNLNYCVGLHFKYFTVQYTVGDGPSAGYGYAYANGSSYCTFDHFDVIGAATDGTYRNQGAYFRDSDNCGVYNFTTKYTGNACVGYADAASVLLHDIEYVNGSCEAYIENCVFVQNGQNIHFNKIRMRNYDLSSGGHADLGQWTSITKAGAGIVDAESGLSFGLLVENCYGEVVTGFTDPQGIGGSTEYSSDVMFRRNCSFCPSTNGMTISGCNRVHVEDNFIQGNTATYGGSRILIRDSTDTCTVINNQANAFQTAASAGTTLPTNLYMPNFVGTGSGANTVIAEAATTADTSLRDTWLAAHSQNIGHW